jgi:hypothetical protein
VGFHRIKGALCFGGRHLLSLAMCCSVLQLSSHFVLASTNIFRFWAHDHETREVIKFDAVEILQLLHGWTICQLMACLPSNAEAATDKILAKDIGRTTKCK